MARCSARWSTSIIITLFVVFLIASIFLIGFWKSVFKSIIDHQLSLANKDTYQYEYWNETPIDITTKIYLFNWTNSDEWNKDKGGTKPTFEEVGPYVYAERNSRANVEFNENNTISFNTVRRFVYLPDQSNGTLDDTVITFNPITLAVANVIKDKPYIIRRAVHYFINDYNISLILKNSVRNFTFGGIEDIQIQMAQKLKVKGFDIPFDKIGWFYERNNSATYDGNYTMWTGADDIEKTGIVTEWNQSNVSKAYTGQCGRIDGTTAEVWYPVKDASTVAIFLSDTCSKLVLENEGSISIDGVEGNKYMATKKLFDNGTKYKDMACFSPGEVLPSGVRNISECKYKAPVFLSLAHFTLADPWYVENINGLHPDPEKYKFGMTLEPNYGFPLEANIAFQANILAQPAENITLFINMSKTLIPMLWVSMSAEVPDNFMTMIKIALAAPTIGFYLGFFFLIIALAIGSAYTYYNLKKRQAKSSF